VVHRTNAFSYSVLSVIAMASSVPLLYLQNVSVAFGGIVALSDVSFEVQRGTICGLIGPNGAGKTTLFNCLSRIYHPRGGAITFDGHDILRLPAHRMAYIGMGRTFQNLALFSSMSVAQNIMSGAHRLMTAGFFSDAIRLPRVRREEARANRIVDELIEFLELSSLAGTPASHLPFGTRKMVELGRALAGQPKLLLLDEPAGGLNHQEVEKLRSLILAIRDKFSMTILLVEHHMGLVMRVSDQVVALDFGRKIADDVPASVQANADVLTAYLGAGA
jgi:branched-chain amino acid transport system ATP-binding protein